MTQIVVFEDIGLEDYHTTHQRQLQYWHQIVQKERGEVVIICSHPSVVTLGRKSTIQDVQNWPGKVVSIERGGQATYHGPGQVIIYPILDLRERNYNVGGLIRGLERSLKKTLCEYYSVASLEFSEKNPTGVWISFRGQERKIASIGIAVKRWVSFHGMAINLDYDPMAFKGINPCGFSQEVMISLEEVLERKISRAEFIENYKKELIEELGRKENE